ncbi:hypothetical protein [Pseudomonas purpurea]|uniref:hypothetical protein n=1 Tax=Pseudomonas purpurea TaxID=3136737 RepID=UPI003265BC05
MSHVQVFVARSRECAGLFRLGRDVEAGLVMVELFGELDSVLGQGGEECRLLWTSLLVEMLDCQERQNWLGLADYLEYELVELLEAGRNA